MFRRFASVLVVVIVALSMGVHASPVLVVFTGVPSGENVDGKYVEAYDIATGEHVCSNFTSANTVELSCLREGYTYVIVGDFVLGTAVEKINVSSNIIYVNLTGDGWITQVVHGIPTGYRSTVNVSLLWTGSSYSIPVEVFSDKRIYYNEKIKLDYGNETFIGGRVFKVRRILVDDEDYDKTIVELDSGFHSVRLFYEETGVYLDVGYIVALSIIGSLLFGVLLYYTYNVYSKKLKKKLSIESENSWVEPV